MAGNGPVCQLSHQKYLIFVLGKYPDILLKISSVFILASVETATQTMVSSFAITPPPAPLKGQLTYM